MISLQGSGWVGSDVEIPNVDNSKPTHSCHWNVFCTYTWTWVCLVFWKVASSKTARSCRQLCDLVHEGRGDQHNALKKSLQLRASMTRFRGCWHTVQRTEKVATHSHCQHNSSPKSTPKISLPAWAARTVLSTLRKMWQYSHFKLQLSRGGAKCQLKTSTQWQLLRRRWCTKTVKHVHPFYILTYLKGFQISVASPRDKASGLKTCRFTWEFDIR